MSSETFTIVMCTYNGELYVSDQLSSIASQTRLPDRLLVVDDRSSDRTCKLVSDFARRAPFAVDLLVNDETLGATKNFEKAIELCEPGLIALSDQDDVWNPDKLERLESVFLKYPATGAVFSDASVVDQFLKPLGYSMWESTGFEARLQNELVNDQAFEVLLKRNRATGATMAFRSEYRDLVLPIPDQWVHDGWIVLLIAAVSSIRLVQDSLLLYRQHDQNLIGGVKKTISSMIRQEGLAHLLARLRQSHQIELASEADRYEQAYQRLQRTASVDPQRLSALTRKTRHLRLRESLAKPRLKRLPTILTELLLLRYKRFSNRSYPALRDLLR